jgi:NADH:ubiquinone oxidoreductase subunit K/NADH:ubiquinone oxidoreductase subunit 6 (subunit J)
MLLQAIAFYVFAAVVVASGAMVVVSRNPVYSVLFLILAFFNAAALFVLIGAEFIAMILVIVYVGAVAVLFLFVVMMLDINMAKLREGFLDYLPIGAMIGVAMLAEILFGLGVWGSGASDTVQAFNRAGIQPVTVDTPGRSARCSTPSTSICSSRGPGAAGRHDRRHRAHPAQPPRRPPPAGQRPALPLEGRDHDRGQGHVAGGRVMVIGLGHYLTVAGVLFTLGILGIFLNRKNVIVILMCVELMLLAVNINLVAFSVYQGNIVGQIFAMLVLTVAAAEAAIGLAILVVYFRSRGSVEVEDINAMKG